MIPHSLGSLGSLLLGTFVFWTKPLDTVERVDLERFMGEWHVIAVMDNPVERQFFQPVETYQLLPEDRIGVAFQWSDKSFEGPRKTHRFRGRVMDRRTNSRWKMHLFPLFPVSYNIIALCPDYKWAAVAHPSRRFGWILARQSRLPETTFQSLMDVFRRAGFDTAKFVKVPQR